MSLFINSEPYNRILRQAYVKRKKPVKWLTKDDTGVSTAFGLPMEVRVGIDKSVKLVIQI